MTRIEFFGGKAVITMPRKEYDLLRSALADLGKAIVGLDGGENDSERERAQGAPLPVAHG